MYKSTYSSTRLGAKFYVIFSANFYIQISEIIGAKYIYLVIFEKDGLLSITPVNL